MLATLADREAAISQALLEKALHGSKPKPVFPLSKQTTTTQVIEVDTKPKQFVEQETTIELNGQMQQEKHAQISTETKDNYSRGFRPETNTNVSRSGEKTTWPIEDQVLVDWIINLQQEHLPVEPFDLYQGVRVINSAGFLASLKQQVEFGPSSARAKSGVLQDDLRQLMEIVKNKQTGIITNVR